MIGCIIQARVGSSRLPRKVLMKVDSENSVLEFIIKQLNFSKLIDKIVIATTSLDEDREILEISKNFGVECFQGNVNDVLDRYYQCAKQFNFSSIVRVTSDCPLIDPNIVDQVISKFNHGDFDYVSNKLNRTFPQGTETEIFSLESFTDVWLNASKSSEREHVTPFYYNNPNVFKISSIDYEKNISNLRWTIDYKNDLQFVTEIISRISSRPILLNNKSTSFVK